MSRGAHVASTESPSSRPRPQTFASRSTPSRDNALDLAAVGDVEQIQPAPAVRSIRAPHVSPPAAAWTLRLALTYSVRKPTVRPASRPSAASSAASPAGTIGCSATDQDAVSSTRCVRCCSCRSVAADDVGERGYAVVSAVTPEGDAGGVRLFGKRRCGSSTRWPRAPLVIVFGVACGKPTPPDLLHAISVLKQETTRRTAIDTRRLRSKGQSSRIVHLYPRLAGSAGAVTRRPPRRCACVPLPQVALIHPSGQPELMKGTGARERTASCNGKRLPVR